ncbi:MAG: BCCT family transporter [Micrococcus sp.]|nr:BCCT family transporter [Micrococcus sp.]
MPTSTATSNDVSPDLVPGTAKLVNWVFWPTAIVVLSFTAAALIAPAATESVISEIQSVLISNFSWWFQLLALGFVVFCLFVAFTRRGRITLGPPDSKPEFSLLSWLSLLFAAGMGIGLVFYGMTEPLMHFNTPRPSIAEGEPSVAVAAEDALSTTFMHWGLQPWAIYAVVGLAIAHAIHRRGRPLSVRWAVEPLIGEKAARGGWGTFIDVFALAGVVFGVATSLGLGVTQMSAGLRSLGVVPPAEESPWFEYVLIFAITLAVLWSVLSGVARGMKWLSNFNLILAAGLVIFLLIVGPTQFLLKETVQTAGSYLQNFIGDSLSTSAFFGEEGDAWQAGWSTFYWAWWMSWTPFVGVFIARISRGRTVREFIMGVLLVPTAISIVWFGTLGGLAIYNEINPPAGYTSVVGEDGSIDVNTALFQVLEQLPGGAILVVGAVILSAVFFITSSDSGSLVMAMISTGGDPEPKRWIRIFFTFMTGGLAAALLAAGGLGAIQALAITIGIPFSILMLLMCVAVFRALGANVRRVEAVRRQAMLASIKDRLGLESDDDVIDAGPVSASVWWASLSRERQQRIAQVASPGPDSEITLHGSTAATTATAVEATTAESAPSEPGDPSGQSGQPPRQA